MEQFLSPLNAGLSSWESPELGELFCALAKAQLNMKVAKKEASNPFFKSSYADLEAIVAAARPALAENGLCVLQRVHDVEGQPYLITRLGHASGQWVESRVPINPPKSDVQSLGSYITYMRRYAYASCVGVIAGGEDDDGERVMQTQRKEGVAPVANPGKLDKGQLDLITKELERMGDERDDLETKILETYAVDRLAFLPKVKFSVIYSRLRNLADMKEKTSKETN